MKLLKRFSLFALTSLFAFSSCDKIEDALSKDIDVKNISFVITTPMDDSGLRADLLPFSGQATFDHNDPQFKDFKDYLSFIDKIKVDEVIIITTTSGNGTIVQNFNLTSPQAGVNYTIPSYAFREEYTSPQLVTASQDILNAILNKKTVELKVNGLSDEKSGNILTHTIIIKKGTITVKLL